MIRPVRRPRDTWDWLTLAELEGAVFAAYLEACRQQTPPKGEPFLYDGPDVFEPQPWASREDFRDCLVGMLGQRINALAQDRGVDRPPAVVYPSLPAGRGWPELMAHGCAAVAVGAGAPPAQVAGADATAHADLLFFGPERQDLPAGEGSKHTQTHMGTTSHE